MDAARVSSDQARQRNAAFRLPPGTRTVSGPRLRGKQKEVVSRDERARILAIPPPPMPDKCPVCALCGRGRDDQTHFVGLEEDGSPPGPESETRPCLVFIEEYRYELDRHGLRQDERDDGVTPNWRQLMGFEDDI